MSFLLYPKNPRPEFRQIEILPKPGDHFYFPNAFMGCLSEFFGMHGIYFTGYDSDSGAMCVDLDDELCQKMADFIEEHGPFGPEELPEEWRDRPEQIFERLSGRKLIKPP